MFIEPNITLAFLRPEPLEVAFSHDTGVREKLLWPS